MIRTSGPHDNAAPRRSDGTTPATASRAQGGGWASRPGRATLALLALAAYVSGDVFVRPFAAGPAGFLPFYLSAGLAFALLLIGGERWFALLFVARLIINWLPSGPQLPLGYAIAAAAMHTAVYAIGAAVVSRRVVVVRPIWRLRDVTWLLAGMYVSACLQALASVLLRTMQTNAAPDDFWPNVSRFAAGDAVGMLVVVPLTLFVLRPLVRRRFRAAAAADVYVGSPDQPVAARAAWLRRVELAMQVLAVLTALIVTAMTIGGPTQIPGGVPVILFLPMAWISAREGLRGGALVITAYGLAALLFARFAAEPALSIPMVQADLLVLGFAGLKLAAAREASAESAARYWQLVATAAEGIWRLDRAGETLSVSPRMAAILGRDEREILGRSASEFIAPEDMEHWMRERRQRSAGRETTYEVRLVRPDGTRVSVLVNASPVRSVTTGEDVGAIAVVTDVTAMRAAERQRRHAQVLLEAAFHSSQDAMELHRVSDDVIIDVNAVWTAVTGVPRDAAVGRALRELGIWGDPADAARMDELVREHGFTRDFEITFNRRGADGASEVGYALLSAYPLKLDDETYMLVSGRDITVEKRAAEGRRQVKRMEELGRLAGGVAHDFNNLLTVIGAYAQMARTSIEGGHPVELADVDEIRSAADRGHELTKRLLAFSRHQPTEVRAIHLEPVLRRADGMLRSLLPGDVRLRMEFGRDVPAIMADVSQLDQVLLNLVVNARDAMPDGGEILLRTSTVHARDGEAGTLVGPDTLPGAYVVLTAIDTGVGMDEATQARIFEPFFTTKPSGEGTGLGLAVIYGIVRQARGAVRVSSTKGHGATFTIFWPATSEIPAPETARAGASRSSPTAGRVLVIEDEAAVRRTTVRVLEDAGFLVSTASDGGAGLARLEQLKREGRPPDVVLSDIAMPVLNGREVAARLLASDPLLPVVLVSGYDSAGDDSAALANVPFPVLTKPYDVPALVAAVRAAIEWRDARVAEVVLSKAKDLHVL